MRHFILALACPGSRSGPSGLLIQVRHKSNSKSGRKADNGVLVRLLRDIPRFGRKGAIFRVERGRMRNQWFLYNRAEYLTPARMRELGLSADDIGERDTEFGVTKESKDLETSSSSFDPEHTVEPGIKPATIQIESVPPEDAQMLLSALLPEPLVFYRQPITKPDGIAATTKPATDIYGSVSIMDIFQQVKAVLMNHSAASRIALSPEHIRLVGVDHVDRIRTLGTSAVHIHVPGSNQAPVTRTLKIAAAGHGHSNS